MHFLFQNNMTIAKLKYIKQYYKKLKSKDHGVQFTSDISYEGLM
jgi:hypothetical protein